MRRIISIFSFISMLLCTTCVWAGDMSDLVKNLAGPANSPTATQVADKALDIVKAGVAEVYGSISKVAPEVWRVAIKMQYVAAAQIIMVPLLILIGLYIGYRKVRKADFIEQEAVEAALVVFMALDGVFLIVLSAYALALIVAPEWYAIQDLVGLVTKK